jgi:lipopolysaccharide transport system permease protein
MKLSNRKYPYLEKPSFVIEPPRRSFSLQLAEFWRYRDLLYILIWRDVKVRYKQTALGIVWVFLQPLISLIIFSFLFGSILGVPSGELPYPLYTLAGLLPWNYFAASLNKSSGSLVINAPIITKVYFPRMLFPVAAVLAGLVDFSISFILMLGLMIYYQIGLSPAILALPLFLLLNILCAIGFSLWLSSLNVRFRDVTYLVPFMVQIWFYLTPVIYASELLPDFIQPLLLLNPLTGIVEGFRWAIFGSQLYAPPSVTMMIVTIVIMVFVLFGGILFFRRIEQSFADII